MEQRDIREILRTNTYPGRGIILGRSPDGEKAMLAYFLMGRSVNSRNRIFVETADGIRTQAYEPEKMTDPSLIIYTPVRVLDQTTIVSNGDQTDTIYTGLTNHLTFEQALRSRTFEPDAPNYTPRISGVLELEDGGMHYALSIIKAADQTGESCQHQLFTYDNPRAGEGHFLHTYQGDGDPLPSFAGEPVPIFVPDDLETFASMLWENLNPDNRVSLFVRAIDLCTGTWASQVINRNQ